VGESIDEQRMLNDEVHGLWEQKAAFWDERLEAGNLFSRVLIGPATERLLAIQPGEVVLDVACGNGALARRLADLGAHVVAVDFSETFLDRARARSVQYADRIEYGIVDATSKEQLLALGQQRFDAASCSMGLMDMVDISALAATLPLLLRPGGRFVFSVQHPCFNSNAVSIVGERGQFGDTITSRFAAKVSAYLTVPPGKGVGMPGEPVPHYYFHRPLSKLLGVFFEAGFALDGLEEPQLDEDTQSASALSWASVRDIPPILVARLRLARR
jgi:2-polyprenyl-3-methyl-5-hydroxy-6-metoxy-1,4-benzoquinol methylase